MDPTVLQRIITGFSQALEPGLATMRPFLLGWISTLIFLEAVRVWGALVQDGHRWQHGVSFLLRTLVFVAAYWGWPSIMTTLIEDFVGAGLRFGGNRLTVQQFLDPGLLLDVGLRTAGPLKDILLANVGLTTPVQALTFLGCWLLYLVAYAIMACNVFLLQIEVRVMLPVALVALGFVFWGPTRSMAGGVLAYGLNAGLVFFIQAILASIIFTLAPILFPPLPRSTAFALAIEQAFIMVVAAGLLAYLFWKIPSTVGRYLTGVPSLTAGGFAQTVAGLAGLAVGGVGLVRSGGAALAGRVAGSQPAAAPRALPPAQTRTGPPPQPLAPQVLSVLRTGAQFLAHDQSHSGPQVPL
jgi:P-type conjugative transfer protein TrbL